MENERFVVNHIESTDEQAPQHSWKNILEPPAKGKNKARYFITPVIIGIIVGVLSLVFIDIMDFFTRLSLGVVAHFTPPRSSGFVGGVESRYTSAPGYPFMIPLVEGMAAFISGVLSYFMIKNPGSLGANKAIRAYHENPESLTLKEAFTTLFTSAMVLGSGGPSGREGAVSMVGGSVGVFIAKLLRQKPHEVREALAIGVGAGLGAMFKAPLAGAIASSEIFFKHDFDIETIIPAFAASAAAYLVVATKVGFSPLFRIGVLPVHSFELRYILWFSIFGIFSGLIARFLLWVFYYISDLFKKLKQPIYVSALIGGVLAGCIGLLSSYAIGNGYGWLQLIMDHKISPGVSELTLGIICVILAMSLIAGSGASGGAFSPTVVIGGLSGALFWHFAKVVSPDVNIPIAMFVVVGMMAVFSVAANAPLSTIVMITEMTGSYGVLLPAMLTVGIAMMFGGEHSLFNAQHDHRSASDHANS